MHRMHPKRLRLAPLAVFAAVALAMLSPGAAHAQQTIPIDPRATYLHTNGDPNAHFATAIDLSLLGLQPGDAIRSERLGDFQAGLNPPFNVDNQPSMFAVFSSDNVLLGPAAPHRVAGAIDAGMDVITFPTLNGDQQTDIPEDFRIPGVGTGGSVELTIPEGAQFLFLTPNDSFFGDNTDPDQDYALRITWDTDGDGLLDDVDPDLDGDGVLDNVDQCVPSDMRTEVDTGSGPTSVANVVDSNGCTIQDYVNAYAQAAENHGQYVSSISSLANQLARQGVITGRQKGELVSGAARSDIGK